MLSSNRLHDIVPTQEDASRPEDDDGWNVNDRDYPVMDIENHRMVQVRDYHLGSAAAEDLCTRPWHRDRRGFWLAFPTLLVAIAMNDDTFGELGYKVDTVRGWIQKGECPPPIKFGLGTPYLLATEVSAVENAVDERWSANDKVALTTTLMLKRRIFLEQLLHILAVQMSSPEREEEVGNALAAKPLKAFCRPARGLQKGGRSTRHMASFDATVIPITHGTARNKLSGGYWWQASTTVDRPQRERTTLLAVYKGHILEAIHECGF